MDLYSVSRPTPTGHDQGGIETGRATKRCPRGDASRRRSAAKKKRGDSGPKGGERANAAGTSPSRTRRKGCPYEGADGTLRDYAKFARLWFESVEPKLLNRTQREELMTPHEGEYAAGWYSVPRNWGSGYVLTHTGTNTYWRVTVWLAPSTDKAYIAAANATNDETHGILDAIIWKLINHEP